MMRLTQFAAVTLVVVAGASACGNTHRPYSVAETVAAFEKHGITLQAEKFSTRVRDVPCERPQPGEKAYDCSAFVVMVNIGRGPDPTWILTSTHVDRPAGLALNVTLYKSSADADKALAASPAVDPIFGKLTYAHRENVIVVCQCSKQGLQRVEDALDDL